MSLGELTELPSANRSVMGFVALLPGVQYNPSNTGPGSVNINGQHRSQVIFVIDGANNNDDMRGGDSGPQARPALESIQEFQVVTNQYDAEYGRGSGGIVNAITEAGHQRPARQRVRLFHRIRRHGPGFLHEAAGSGPAHTSQQWGGTIGGPIVRDKIHFFASFENVNQNQGSAACTDQIGPDVLGRRLQRFLEHGRPGRLSGQCAELVHLPVAERLPADPAAIGQHQSGAGNDPRQTLSALHDERDWDQTGMFFYNRVLGARN